jgi:uncharacterized membrane protein YkvA (DUF1232 family)
MIGRRPRHGPSLVRRLRIEAHAAWLAARDPRCPWHARAWGLLVTAYAFSPIDLIPDFIPVLGLLDDALLVPAGLWLFARMLPPGLLDECRTRAAAAAERPGSAAGAAIVALLWLASGLLVLHLLGFRFV